MPKFIITDSMRYEVEADSAEQALDSFYVTYQGVEAEAVKTKPADILSYDWFDYLDGTVTVETKESK